MYTKKKSIYNSSNKTKRSTRVGLNEIKYILLTNSDGVFDFLNSSNNIQFERKNNYDDYLQYIQSSRGYIDPKGNQRLLKLLKQDDELFDEKGSLKQNKSWDDVNIRFGFPLHDSVVGYINHIKQNNTIFLLNGNEEVLALCSFAFVDNETGLLNEDNVCTNHIHILSLVNNSSTIKNFTDIILTIFSKLKKVKYISLNPLINKELNYTHLTKFYGEKHFKYINDSTCSNSGSCVLSFTFEPPRRLKINEDDYSFSVDRNYYEDINKAYKTLKKEFQYTDKATIKTLGAVLNILKEKKNQEREDGEKSIIWKWKGVEIDFRLLSHDYDDRRNVDLGPIEGVEIVNVSYNRDEGINLLNKYILNHFNKSIFHSFKFQKIFITRVKSTDIHDHLVKNVGFQPYTECQNKFTSEYCRMVKDNNRQYSEQAMNNSSPSLSPRPRQHMSSMSSSDSLSLSPRPRQHMSSMSSSNLPSRGRESASIQQTRRNTKSVSSSSSVPPQLDTLVCKVQGQGSGPSGSSGSSGSSGQMGSNKIKDHPIYDKSRDGTDADFSRFRVMMRLSEYIRRDLGFEVLQETYGKKRRYIKYIDEESGKSYFLLKTNKSNDIPGYNRSLNLIIECNSHLTSNQSRSQDYLLYKGQNLSGPVPKFDDFEEQGMNSSRITPLSENERPDVLKFFTFKVYCFALSDTVKGPKKIVELIPSKKEDVHRAVFKFVRGILCKSDGKDGLTIRAGTDFNTFESEVNKVKERFDNGVALWYEDNLK